MSPREALREAVAAEHKLHLQLRELEEDAARWRRRAVLASERNEPELAGQALSRARELDDRAAKVRGHYDEHAAFIRAAKARLRSVAPSPEGDVPVRLSRLEAEDRLARDLEALKAQLASR
jgi:phage shock protein A